MNLAVFFNLLFLAWVAYAGYRLWMASPSITTRVSAMVLAAALAWGTLKNLYEALMLTGRF